MGIPFFFSVEERFLQDACGWERCASTSLLLGRGEAPFWPFLFWPVPLLTNSSFGLFFTLFFFCGFGDLCLFFPLDKCWPPVLGHRPNLANSGDRLDVAELALPAAWFRLQ